MMQRRTTIPIPAGLILHGALLMVGGLLLAAPVVGGESQRDAARRAAVEALARRNPIAAEVGLRQAITQGVAANDLRAYLGEALYAEGAWQESARVLDAGPFSADSAGRGWRIRGQLALSRGDTQGAQRAFDEGLRQAPNDADLWASTASLRFTVGEEAQAIEAAERSVALDPGNPRSLALRGMLIREQYGLSASLPWFEAALKAHPDEPALLGEYAATLGDLGQYRAMLAVCRRLVEVDPRNPRALFLQAVLAARAGRTDLALTILERAGDSLRDMPAAILLGGVLQFHAGNADLAVAAFERLTQMQPDNPVVRQLLARALARQGDWRRLTRELDDDARRADASPYLMTLVGDAWAKLGDVGRGEAYRSRVQHPFSMRTPAVPLDTHQSLAGLAQRYADAPASATNAVPYIRALLAAGRLDEAQRVADGLSDANPGTAEAHLLSGDVRLMRGDAAGALGDYASGAAIRFNQPVLLRMDAALRAAGRVADADSMTSRYLAQNPSSLAAMELLAQAWSGPASRHPVEARLLSDALAARGQVTPST